MTERFPLSDRQILCCLGVALCVATLGLTAPEFVEAKEKAKKKVPPSWPELGAEAPIVPFVEAAFRDATPLAAGLSATELERWLEPLPGKDAQLQAGKEAGTPVAGFEGLARLRAAWRTDAVLQMSPFDHDGLGIHFWNGTTGVSLYYYEHPRPMWAGYRTTRVAGQSTPATHVLLATDDDRYARTLRGTIELRHQTESLVLSRGNLRLVTLPLAEIPEEVVFERRASFRSFAMYRGESIPDEAASDGRPLFEEPSISRLPWDDKPLAEGTRKLEEGGGVTLARTASAGTVRSAIRLPRSGLYEVRVRLGRCDAGTGLYLGDGTDKPRVIVGMQRHDPSNANVLSFLKPDATHFDASGDVRGQRIPFSGPEQWLRLLVGPGTVTCQVSGDGHHWSRAMEPLRGLSGPFSEFGLIALRREKPSQITLNKLEIRDLDRLSNASGPDLRERVPRDVLKPIAKLSRWFDVVLDSQPAGVSTRAWRMACALETLSQGAPGTFGNTIFAGFLDDCLESETPPDRMQAILREAAPLYDGWDAPTCYRFTQLFDRLGTMSVRRGEPTPYSRVEAGLLANGLATSAQFQTMPEFLVRAEVLGHVSRRQWTELGALCQRLRFWSTASRPEPTWPEHRQRLRGLLDWAGGLASWESNQALPDVGQNRVTLSPVIVPAGKDGLTLLGELQIALADDRYEDACRLLVESRPEQAGALLPAFDEPDRFVRLPLLISAGMRKFPEWPRVMRDRFGRLAHARVQTAVAAGSAEELRFASSQFAGTPAATDALIWLGDRALVAGNFMGALDEFEEAALTADTSRRNDLAGRLQLCQAYLAAYRLAPSPGVGPQEPAAFPKGLAQALAELRSRSESVTVVETEQVPFPAGVWEAEVIPDLQIEEGVPPASPELLALDWSAAQFGHALAGAFLYAQNRRQLACFNLKTGRRLWQLQAPEPDPVIADFPMLAFQPVISGGRIFARWSRKDGLSLGCYDAVSGKDRWRSDRGTHVCSTPLLMPGGLYYFSISSVPLDRTWRLDLTVVDPDSGVLISQTPVLELQRSTGRPYDCPTVIAGNRLIASIAGAVLCCDLSGQPVWLRRQPWLPATADTDAPFESFNVPLIAGDRLILLPSGVPEVSCLDSRTGREIWRRPIADARQLLGIDDTRVYVRTALGLAAISLDDGAIAWWRPAGELLSASYVSRTGDLLIVQREGLPNNTARPLLTWIDRKTGRDLAVWPLAELTTRNPQLGPIIPGNREFLVVAGEGGAPSKRALFKLTPQAGPAFPAHVADEGVEAWSESFSDPLTRFLATRFLPRWSLVGGIADQGAGFRDEYAGETEVFATRSGGDQPIRFTCELPPRPGASKGARLRIRAGHERGETWKLLVHGGGRVLLSTVVDASTTKNNWGTWDVDLSELERLGARLVVEQVPLERAAWGYWKQLEIVR